VEGRLELIAGLQIGGRNRFHPFPKERMACRDEDAVTRVEPDAHERRRVARHHLDELAEPEPARREPRQHGEALVRRVGHRDRPLGRLDEARRGEAARPVVGRHAGRR
jgi:hypothetical protein